MMSKEEFLEYVRNRMDPDEIVDEFGLSSEELTYMNGNLLYARRYRIAYRFDEDELEDLGYESEDDYIPEEYDEEAWSLRAIDEFDDLFKEE